MYRVFYKRYSNDGIYLGEGILPGHYKHKSSATRAAKEQLSPGKTTYCVWEIREDKE